MAVRVAAPIRGTSRHAFLSALITLLALTCCLPAGAVEPGELLLTVKVNHGAAYREGSWAPVDVIVENEYKDIEGHVEVRLFTASNELLSPTYQLPAECPKGFKGRFRLNCKMAGVDRVEAQLFHGRRGVNPVSWLRIQPIARDDFLCLVLDQTPSDYAFLSTALYRENRKVRFHREALTTAELPSLADFPQCYEAFDLIVMGRIDPSYVLEPHREVFRQYVEAGGTLVACLGEGGRAYRDTWVEELLGVDIGASDVVNAQDLAAAVFGDNQLAPEFRARQGVVTNLTPVSEGVSTVGAQRTLATVRALGAGRAVAVSADVGSGLLQPHPGYQDFWRQLTVRGGRLPDLDFTGLASLSGRELPSLAGVRLFPVESVVLYLVLYFVIAIVLNWLFWSWMKRREFAWLCLVFFSFGFTGYAMFFGTQGRAKKTELERVEVLQIPQGATVARSTVLEGVLAAGSGRFSGSVPRPSSLVDDLSDAAGNTNYYGGPRRRGTVRPFRFIQDEPARIDNLRIGASEMRLIAVESYLPLEGTLEGEVTLQGDRIRCEVQDNTGLVLSNAELYYGGRSYVFGPEDGALRLDKAIHQGGEVAPGSMPSFYGNVEMGGFKSRARATLLRMGQQGGNYSVNYGMPMPPGGGNPVPEFWEKPLLLAWVNTRPEAVLDMDLPAEEKLKATLVVAELPLNDLRTLEGEGIELLVDMPQTMAKKRVAGQTGLMGFVMVDGTSGKAVSAADGETPFEIILPEWAWKRKEPYGVGLSLDHTIGHTARYYMQPDPEQIQIEAFPSNQAQWRLEACVLAGEVRKPLTPSKDLEGHVEYRFEVTPDLLDERHGRLKGVITLTTGDKDEDARIGIQANRRNQRIPAARFTITAVAISADKTNQ